MKLSNILLLIYIFAAITILICFFGCKAQQPSTVVTQHRIDTLYKTRDVQHNIYMHDSIFIHQKGDTVFHDRWHTKYIHNSRIDTIYKNTTDSVPVPYPVIQKERYTPVFYKYSTAALWCLIGLFLLWLAWKVFKRYYLHIR